MIRFLGKRKPEAPTVNPEDAEFNHQFKAWMDQTNDRSWVPPEAEVTAVQFGLLSKADIEGLSAVEITQPHTQKTNMIQKNGATDARLGSANRSMLCSTCACSNDTCGVGHSGHLPLRYPIVNGEHIKLVLKIMDSVCINCCRLRLPKDFPRYESIISIPNQKERLRQLVTKCKNRSICESHAATVRRQKLIQRMKRKGDEALLEEAEPEAVPVDVSIEDLLKLGMGCNTVNPYWIAEDNIFLRPVFTLTKEDKSRFEAKDPTWKAPVFTPDDMLYVLKHIPDEDIRILGMHPEHSHPSSLMWTSLYIPTINIRPNKIGRVIGNNRAVNEDDLTYRLKSIVRNNILLTSRIKAQEKKGGDTIVNLAKYVFEGSSGKTEYNTAEGAFYGSERKSNGTSTKRQFLTTLLLYERSYISVVSYQDDRLKGKGTQLFGKVRNSIRTRFGNQKRDRIRGSVMGKRMNFTCRSVVSPNPLMHIREAEVPLMVAMHLTYPARVNRYNIHELTSMVRRGPRAYPGARYVFDLEGEMCDLDSPLRHTIELKIGMIVERHLIRGDYVLMNRQPSLHQHSMMAHRLIIHPDPDVKSIGLHLAVTTSYNADFDGDEMNMMVLQGEMERAEAHTLMLVDEMIMKDDQVIIGFVQNAPVSARLLTKPETKLNRTDAAQLLMQHRQWNGQWNGRLPWDDSEKTEISGHEVFSCILPKDFELHTGDVVIEHGVMKSGCWSKSTLKVLIHMMFRDYGSTFTADFISGTYDLLNWYATSVQGFTVALDDVYIPSQELGLPEIARKCSDYFQTFPNHHPNSRSGMIIEDNLCALSDRMITILGQRAIRILKGRGHQNGMLDMTISGAKGDLKNVVQVSGIMGQQYNHLSKRFPQPTCHYTHPSMDRAKAHGMIYSNFMYGMDSHEFFNHLRCSRSGLVDTAVKTSKTGYIHRKVAKSLEDMTTNMLGQVVNTQGEILQMSFGYDGYVARELETDHLHILLDAEWRSHYTANEQTRIEPIRNMMLHQSFPAHQDTHSLSSIQSPINLTRILRKLHHTGQPHSADYIETWRDQILNALRTHPKLELYMYEKLSVHALQRIRPDLQTLEAHILKRFAKARVPNGEMVGQQSAQSIGEPLTQMTLNTFHVAGSASSLTTGIPRGEEIINASNKLATPSMKIFSKQPQSEVKMNELAASLIFRPLVSFIEGHELNPADREPYEEQILAAEEDEAASEASASNDEEDHPDPETETVFDESGLENFLLIIHITKEVPTALGRICNRCRACVKLPSIKWIFGEDQNGKWIGVAGSLADPTLKNWVSKMGLKGYDMNLVKDLLMEHLGSVHCGGIRNLSEASVCRTKVSRIVSDQLETSDVFYIITRGTNLRSVLHLPWVDSFRTSTNDILEIQEVLGIDAARAAIVRELTSVMSSSGAAVKYRYINLLSERMTMRGKVMPTTALGICQPGTSVLRNASFENSMENFFIGALRGDRDECKGMTECVVMNRQLQGGTGVVDVRAMKAPAQPFALAYRPTYIPVPEEAWTKQFRIPFKPAVTPVTSAAAAQKTSTSASRRRKRALQTDTIQRPRRKPSENVRTKLDQIPVVKTLHNMGFQTLGCQFKPRNAPFKFFGCDIVDVNPTFKPPNTSFTFFIDK